ncbi:methyl-accepting chemotaxis protein [Pseudomonas syringae]|uniref:methyl-accepting chemotaxis protein n=1 Tax=Pseudomonas syringae TaxID=317 RepID=UPI001F4690F0|nr:methyl-accepting chemotaxis protein [Pseudomonas syringae]MCF5371318.1 hypothetical protein [Pseudomonas syringae]
MSKTLLVPSCVVAMVLAGAFTGFCALQYIQDVKADRYYATQANNLQSSTLNTLTLSMRAATDATYLNQLQQAATQVDASIGSLRNGSASNGIDPLPSMGSSSMEHLEASWARISNSVMQILASRSANSGFDRQLAESTQVAASLLSESRLAIDRIIASPSVNETLKQNLEKVRSNLVDGIQGLANSPAPSADNLSLALEASKAYVSALSRLGASMRLDNSLTEPLLKSFRTAQILNRSALKSVEASSGSIENGPHVRAILAEKDNLDAAIGSLMTAVNAMPKSHAISPLIMLASIGITLTMVLVGVTLILREANARTRQAEALGASIQNSQKERSQDIRQLFDEMEKVSQGDLTVAFKTGSGSTDEIAATLNNTFGEVRNIIKDVQQTIVSLSAASEQTLTMAKNVNRNRGEQDAAIQHIGRLVDELGSFTKELDDLSSRTRESSQEVTEQISTGTQSVQEVHEGVLKLSQSNMNIMHQTKAMTENIQSLERFVELVRRVANQSSTLAFNAHLAADQISDADLSKRMRLSAEAMTNLTESTSEASEQIAMSLRGINDAAKDTQVVLDESQKDIKALNNKSEHALKAMNSIRDQTTTLATRIISVAGQTADLTQRSEQVSETMGQIHHYASEHSAASEQTAAAINSLNSQAQRVGVMLDRYTV